MFIVIVVFADVSSLLVVNDNAWMGFKYTFLVNILLQGGGLTIQPYVIYSQPSTSSKESTLLCHWQTIWRKLLFLTGRHIIVWRGLKLSGWDVTPTHCDCSDKKGLILNSLLTFLFICCLSGKINANITIFNVFSFRKINLFIENACLEYLGFNANRSENHY